MKKQLILGAALATLMAAPALAQSYNPTYGTGNTLPFSASWHGQSATFGLDHAYAPSSALLQRLRGIRAQAMPAATDDPVYVYGRYAGADPDANIRFQLHRDPPGLD
jgi:hypothetical protein